jgi:hypothetical protein
MTSAFVPVCPVNQPDSRRGARSDGRQASKPCLSGSQRTGPAPLAGSALLLSRHSQQMVRNANESSVVSDCLVFQVLPMEFCLQPWLGTNQMRGTSIVTICFQPQPGLGAAS